METVIELRKKANRLGKLGSPEKTSNNRRQQSKTQTGSGDDTKEIQISNFPQETWKLLSQHVKSWFGQLSKVAREGKTVTVTYGQQYSSPRKVNKKKTNESREKDPGNNEEPVTTKEKKTAG